MRKTHGRLADEGANERRARRPHAGLLALLLVSALSCAPAAAQTGAAPYSGKQIRLVIASGPGGGYDVYARVLAAHLGNHIPGHPSVVSENMPGAGGMVAVNWAYNSAPRDGTVILASFDAVLSSPLFSDPSARFDPRRFESIGSIGKQQNVCATWHTSPIKTVAQAKTRKVNMAAAGAGSNTATLPAVMNAMLGTKFNIVFGYSTGEMRLALQRDEAEGICGLSWTTLKASNPEWVKDHRLNLLAQTGDRPESDLPHVPVLVDLVSNPDDKKVLRVLEFPEELGRPFMMPPGSPARMVATIRTAFDETLKDPAFLADAAKASLDIDPTSGPDMARIIAEAYATPPALVKRAAPFSGAPPR